MFPTDVVIVAGARTPMSRYMPMALRKVLMTVVVASGCSSIGMCPAFSTVVSVAVLIAVAIDRWRAELARVFTLFLPRALRVELE